MPASGAASIETIQITDDSGSGRWSKPVLDDGVLAWHAHPSSPTLFPDFHVAVLNRPPSDISLSHSAVRENRPAGTVVGTLSTTDPDVLDAIAYTLVAGPGGSDNALFSIADGALHTAAPSNYESKSGYSVRIRATDQGGLWHEETFIISVEDQEEPPFSVLAFSRDPAGGLGISWTSEAGYAYQVQYSDTLREDDWRDLGPPRTWSGGELRMHFSGGLPEDVDRRFYRIKRTTLP